MTFGADRSGKTTGGDPGAAAWFVLLTGREREVLALVLEGRRDKEIAAALGISLRTVEKHVERLRKKLAVNSRKKLASASGRAKNT